VRAENYATLKDITLGCAYMDTLHTDPFFPLNYKYHIQSGSIARTVVSLQHYDPLNVTGTDSRNPSITLTQIYNIQN